MHELSVRARRCGKEAVETKEGGRAERDEGGALDRARHPWHTTASTVTAANPAPRRSRCSSPRQIEAGLPQIEAPPPGHWDSPPMATPRPRRPRHHPARGLLRQKSAGKRASNRKTIITFKYAHRFTRFEGTKCILKHWSQSLKTYTYH